MFRRGVFPLAVVLFGFGHGLAEANSPFRVELAQDTWRRVDRELPWPAPRLLWQGEPLVSPRGLNLFGELLFVTDPGDRANPDTKPARIVRFRLVQGIPRDPEILFLRPGFLYSAKWSVPTLLDGELNLIVADQGKELPDGTFTGEGAKIFLLPISPGGEAGEPEVLWEGLPFGCPTGLARVDDFIFISDPCAGPLITRPELPDHPYPSSAIFALRLEGGESPRQIHAGQPFSSLIGVCPAVPGELIFTDTDSGRLDPTQSGGRPGFAPPASADRWILKIIGTDPPTLGSPTRTRFTEDGPVSLRFPNLPASFVVTITGSPGVMIHSPSAGGRPFKSVTLSSDDLSEEGLLTVNTTTEATLSVVCLTVRVKLSNGAWFERFLCLDKDSSQATQLIDNKHGGKATIAPPGFFSQARSRLDFFTTDSAPGHAAVWIYPGGGGTPVAIAKGAPLARPLAGQLSADSSELWLTDQAMAALYVLPFPSAEMFDLLFPFRDWSH